jgi:hypothetical protein
MVLKIFGRVDLAAKDFETDYLVDLQLRVEEQEAKKRAIAKAGMKRLEKDMQQANLNNKS